jgi:hypothetical protein
MVLSYLVSTAGHAQSQNHDYPHDIRTIVQIVTEGAEEFGDEQVVGFTSPGTAEGSGEASWTCDRYCKWLGVNGHSDADEYSFQTDLGVVGFYGCRSGGFGNRGQQGCNEDGVDTLPNRARLLDCMDYLDADGIRGCSGCVSPCLTTAVFC